MSVVVLYHKKFLQSKDIYIKLAIAFIPAAILGKLLNDRIDQWLENATMVAISFILGGIILLFVDKWFAKNESEGEEEPSKQSAFKIGLFQCIALIPGVSRSASTIVGGLTQKLTRKAAAEFSFLLAIPTMMAATGYKLLKFYNQGGGFTGEEIKLLAVGNIMAFIIAMIAIRSFIGYLSKFGFRIFGYYRIIIGILIIILQLAGLKLSMI
jgi:undecaprenyl-diphosphatase